VRPRKGLRRYAPACAGKRTPTGICAVSVTFSSPATTRQRAKGEIDLIGYDGETLAFVEVRTRLAVKGKSALPELSITREKHEVLVRTAHYFLRERHLKECPVRFDVVAIDNIPGQPPAVRLHKAALSPRA
jgi:putative endonuclease